MTDPQIEFATHIAVLATRLRDRADTVVARALLDNDPEALQAAYAALASAQEVLDEAIRHGRRDLCYRCGRPFEEHRVAFLEADPEAQRAEFEFETGGIYCR